MNRRATLLMLLSLVVSSEVLWAQGTIKEGFVTEEFPEVSFVWHERNPEPLGVEDFQYFAENGEPREFVVENLQASVDKDVAKHVVFLWEDLAYHGANLYDFSRSSLLRFIEDVTLRPDDKINVSVYGRRMLDEDSYLKDLTDGFVSDKGTLVSAVQNYKRNHRTYKDFPNRTDIFPAVCQAIDLLNAQDADVKAIVVITAGYPLDNSSASSDMNARLRAEKYHVPVYFIQYGRDHGFSPKLSEFAPLTYGTFECFADLNQKANVEAASAAIGHIFDSITERYYGQDYKISFVSDAKRGDEARLLEFRINDYDYKEQLVPPSRSLKAFAKDHPIIFSMIVMLILSVLALAVVFYVMHRISEARQFEALRNQDEMDRRNAMNAIEQTKEKLGSELRNIRKTEIPLVPSDLEMKFLQLGRYPRLVFDDGSGAVTYTVSKVETFIGRSADNDVVLTEPTVGRKHARIFFNGESFILEDLHSRNGVYVNSRRLAGPYVLKHNDEFRVAAALVKVYW